MKQILLFLTTLCAPLLVVSQINTPSTGVLWTTSLSWQQLKEIAKKQNKYIFMDCFTTWCSPCKKMDLETYPNASVGRLINDKFIAVRVQMDKTKNDNADIQAWYKDAKEIEKHYMLDGFPSFLFFSPNGNLVHKATGFMDTTKFIGLTMDALLPGKIIKDDYAEYQSLVATFRMGDSISNEHLLFMTTIAKKIGDTISREFVNKHQWYVSSLPAKERYTEQNIAFWATLNMPCKSNIVKFFFKDERYIDRVMKVKGYSRTQVNKCIQNFIVNPFIYEQLKNPEAKSGVTTINSATGMSISNASVCEEADWKKLQASIDSQFNRSYSRINILRAKIVWYQKNSNWLAYVRSVLELYKLQPPDFKDFLDCERLNDMGWNAFIHINDKTLIRKSIDWIDRLVQAWNNDSDYQFQLRNVIDTYANLLYKYGNVERAIFWQEKAVKMGGFDKNMQEALGKMKKGEATYGVKPF